MSFKKFRLIYSISWNLLLITTGALIFSIGVKAIVVPKGFITGGIAGVSLLAYYFSEIFSPGVWYFIINIPLFIVGLVMVSRRFFLYSIYGMVMASFFMGLVNFQIPINDPFLSVLAGGTIIGAGAGVVLHSLGSLGGNDIVAILFNQKYNIRMGTYFFIFNIVLFTFSFGILSVDTVLYSLAMSYVTSIVLDQVLTMFNQRKMALIVSDESKKPLQKISTNDSGGGQHIYTAAVLTLEKEKISS